MTHATRRELLQPRAWLRAAESLDLVTEPARAAARVPATPPWARVAERVMPDAELRALAARHGLEHRFDDLWQLARYSARLLPDPAGGAWVARITDGSNARREGGRLVVCVLDLGHLGPGVPAADREGTTLQLAFDDEPLRSAGHGLIDCGAASVRMAEPGEALTWPEGVRMSVAIERSLPRVWSAAVVPLGFSDGEAERFARLRLAVADWQATSLFDTTDSACSFDRVCGYPDETTGLMPERCGGDPDDWQLLLQLTVSGWGGLGWRPKPQRMYWWITESCLAAGVFDDARVFAH